ncbi:MAG TPA: hypothetical protein VEA44_01755 [Caulobacter sp.]|nr:hypothetical protein [Caulobacter sp.]
MILRPKVLGIGVAALALAAATGAAAQQKPAERAGALKAVVDCRAIQDPTARLACYDSAAAALDAAEAKGDVVVVDRQQMREARRAAFGFNFQMPSFMSRGEQPEELDRIESTIGSARQDPHGKWIIKLADGALWKQIDSEKLRKKPPPGAKVEIRTASLGSYFLKVEGLGVIRAKREN